MARHYWGERSDDIGGCRYWVGFGVLLAAVILLTVMIFSCMESPVSKVKKDATEDSAANYGAECAAGCGALCGA
nr:hypothetical protein BVC80_5169g2 [Ipomoea trifida]